MLHRADPRTPRLLRRTLITAGAAGLVFALEFLVELVAAPRLQRPLELAVATAVVAVVQTRCTRTTTNDIAGNSVMLHSIHYRLDDLAQLARRGGPAIRPSRNETVNDWLAHRGGGE